MTMKSFLYLPIIVVSFSISACKQDPEYIDLATGKEIKLTKDEESGLMVNSETMEPAGIYVNKQTNDTIDGSTGEVINNNVTKSSGSFARKKKVSELTRRLKGRNPDPDGDGVYKVKIEDEEGEYMKEVEKDGDITIKRNDTKIKIDGETGERKIKKD